jgi:hypothetical protein
MRTKALPEQPVPSDVFDVGEHDFAGEHPQVASDLIPAEKTSHEKSAVAELILKQVKRDGTMLVVGGEKMDLSQPTNSHLPFPVLTEVAIPGSLLSFGYGKSTFALRRQGEKLVVTTTLDGAKPQSHAIDSLTAFRHEVARFKGNVQFKVRTAELGRRAGETDDQDDEAVEIDEADTKPYTPESQIPKITEAIVTENSVHTKKEVDAQFDELIEDDLEPEITVVEERVHEVAPENKQAIFDLVAELKHEGYDDSYYKQIQPEFPTHDTRLARVGSAARVAGSSTTGGEGSRFAVPETKPVVHENRTALVNEVSPSGALGAAVIESSDARAGQAAQQITSEGLKLDECSLEANFKAVHDITHRLAQPGKYLSMATTRVEANGQVTMGAWGDAQILTVKDGERIRHGMIEDRPNVPLKSEQANVEVGPHIEMRSFTADDGTQIIQATAEFWKRVSEYEVEKLSKRYKGQALEQMLFRLSYERINSAASYKVEVGPKNFQTFPAAKGEGGSFALQVVLVDRPEQRGLLSKLGRSRFGKWVRGAALVAFGLSATADTHPEGKHAPLAPDIERVEKRAAPPHEVKTGNSQREAATGMAVDMRRDNERQILPLLIAFNKELKFLGTSPDDRGRIVWMASVFKEVLRGKNIAGFSREEFAEFGQVVPQSGKFEITDTEKFGTFLTTLAEASKERKHISTAKRYAETTYRDFFEKGKK